MIYLDASYIVKSYLQEIGTSEVMALVQTNADRSSAAHARTKVWSGIHRRICDRSLSLADARNLWLQFEHDEALDVWHWLSVTENVIKRACNVFEKLPVDVFLRSSDALHLACAAENRLGEVYSGDRIFLAAAKHFGLNGVKVY